MSWDFSRIRKASSTNINRVECRLQEEIRQTLNENRTNINRVECRFD